MRPILFLAPGLRGRRAIATTVPHGRFPMPAMGLTLAGVSRDATGTPLAGCTCTLFKVNTQNGYPVFTQYATTISDGSGNYSFNVGFDGPYRVTFDLDGAPVRAGLTLKTLSGV